MYSTDANAPRPTRLVVHREEDARDELQHEHDRGDDAEAVPDVEVLRRVVLGGVLLDELRHRETIVDPRAERARPRPEPIEDVRFGARHYEFPVSEPIRIVLSLMKRYGGTGKIRGAPERPRTRGPRGRTSSRGTGSRSRPATSARDPRARPRSAAVGAQPRCVQTPSDARGAAGGCCDARSARSSAASSLRDVGVAKQRRRPSSARRASRCERRTI